MSSRLLLAGPAFLVTILGVALALAARDFGPVTAAALIVGAFAIGLLADRAAKALLPNRPRTAVALFLLWSLCPGIMAATFIAIIIYLNATFDPGDLGMKGLDKEMMKTTLTAIIALLTAMFIKLMDDADESVIGEHVKNAFFAKFKDSKEWDRSSGDYPVVLGESPLEEPIFGTDYNDLKAWTGKARRARSRSIAAGLIDPKEIARVAKLRAGGQAAADNARNGPAA